MQRPNRRPLAITMLRTIALVLLAIAASVPHAREAATRLDGVGLVADVDLLEHAYTSLHPGLYRYATPAQTTQRFDALRKELGQGASLAEAFTALSRFAASVRCGHTYANFLNQSADVQHALFEPGRGRLPFHFRWIDRKMVVTRNGSNNPGLVPGTEIQSINGTAAHTILERLLPLARADGSNEAKRIAQLEVRGDDRFEAFDVYLSLLFPQFGHRLRLQVLVPGSNTARAVSVLGLSAGERTAMRESSRLRADAPAWALDLSRPGLAVLRMPNWALFNSSWDWRAALDASFAQLAAEQIPALVIDLRGNEGGLSIGDDLIGHLVARPLPRVAYRQLVRYRAVPDSLRPYLKTWDASFKDWNDHARPFDDRYFTLTRWQRADGPDLIQPRAPHYAGKVYVLTDAANSSATFEFANDIKASGLATLVGQTTGGNRRGINGSAFFFLTLPNSGIELDLPLVGQFPLREQPDAGVEPDFPVESLSSDIAAGRDRQMEKVISLLNQQAGQ